MARGFFSAPIIRDYEPEMKRLWCETDMPCSEIAAKFGVSKNTMLGLAHRRGWHRDTGDEWPYERTMLGRLEAIHRRMDAVNAESKAAIAAHRPES